VDTSRPLVSIGLPVYNGEAHLEAALKSLLAQDYENFEIVICDNASTDGTEGICRPFASRHANVRYIRNPENLGAMPNFSRVVDNSQGKWFMWAAHDDLWQGNYVSALVDCLETEPEAVLATPTTIHMQEDGAYTSHVDRPAMRPTALGNLRMLFDDYAASWIYGLYRVRWLRDHFRELEDYPVWGSDIYWLASVLLQYKVVGSPHALIYKRMKPSVYGPTTRISKFNFRLSMLIWLSRVSFTSPRRWPIRLKAFLLSCRFFYKVTVQRKNPVATFFQSVKLVGVALASATVCLFGWMKNPLRPQNETGAARFRIGEGTAS